MRMREWVILPTKWILDRGLARLRWGPTQGANNIAALMVLIAIAHRADADTGEAKVTYDAIAEATDLSRAKISGGLDVLLELGVIERSPVGRSTYQLVGYDKTAGWGKLPARQLYSSKVIASFMTFSKRSPVELHALKMYLLFISLRDNSSNMATISYDKIAGYTGIDRGQIKRAQSLLVTNGLVYVERQARSQNEFGIANSYRILHLDSFNHMGTKGRTTAAADFASPASSDDFADLVAAQTWN